MGKKHKIASNFSPFSPCPERFMSRGYRDPIPLKEQIKLASQIKGLSGIGFGFPYPFSEEEKEGIRSFISESGLVLCIIEPGLYSDRKWKYGSLSSPDAGIRREAVELFKRCIDSAVEVGVDHVSLWPGQDGFDYLFQVDYKKAWDHLVEGIEEAAEYNPEVRIAVEYKPKEPRTNSFIRNAGTTLYLIKCIDMPNVGGVVDLGHSLIAGENPAEAAVLLAREDKLFSIHLNDNYRDWDHDLIVGTACFWETLEFFYWLNRVGYDGWYIMDLFPYREDGFSALQASVDNSLKMLRMAEKLQETGLAASMDNNDVVEAIRILWKSILKE